MTNGKKINYRHARVDKNKQWLKEHPGTKITESYPELLLHRHIPESINIPYVGEKTASILQHVLLTSVRNWKKGNACFGVRSKRCSPLWP